MYPRTVGIGAWSSRAVIIALHSKSYRSALGLVSLYCFQDMDLLQHKFLMRQLPIFQTT